MVENNKIDDNLMSITPLIASNDIEVETILGGSVRYSYNYFMKKNDLPKIHAVFIDPIHKWQEDPIFSLEFKMGQDFTLIYSHLKSLQADYEYRNIQGSIDVIRITSKSIPVIAYLSNLYKGVSYEASYLLSASLFPMMNWAVDKYEPTLAQDFGIWAAHWSGPEEVSIARKKEDNQCFTHMTCEYKNITIYMEEQNKIAVENSYKDQYKRMSLDEKMESMRC